MGERRRGGGAGWALKLVWWWMVLSKFAALLDLFEIVGRQSVVIR